MSEKLEGIIAIKSIVDNYRKTGIGFADIQGLIYMRKQLVTNLCFYVELVNELKMEYDTHYAKRKALFAEKKNFYLTEGDNSSVATSKAEKDIKKEVEDEKYFESKLFEGKQNIDIFKEVGDTMKQQISYLKQEKQNSNIQT